MKAIEFRVSLNPNGGTSQLREHTENTWKSEEEEDEEEEEEKKA